jgi:predicted DCC family thiol-disulfide oxidoreductase YuxK
MEDYSYRDDPEVPSFPDDKPVIVFDGQCVFCSGWVKFALKRDKKKAYRFMTAQSLTGAALYRHYGLDDRHYETNMLLVDGRPYFRSEGSIRMVAGLGFPWSLLKVFKIVPRGLLDRAYEFVARNRFRLAGRMETCYVPMPDDRARFIG